jgi:hypothetical protein
MIKHIEMRKRVKALICAWSVSVGLLSLGLLTAQVTAAQGTSPEEVLRAFIAASNKGDTAAMRALADPAFALIEDTHRPNAHTESFAEFTAPPLGQSTLNSVQQTAPNTVVIDVTLTGPKVPPVRVPFRDTFTVTVANGLVVQMVETIPPSTLDALRALGAGPGSQPGMPKTGNGNATGLIQSIALLGLLAGAVMSAGILVLRGRRQAR